MDLATPGTRETPRRFLQALHDATAGYDGDPKLRTAFPSERPHAVDGSHSQIIEGPIVFHALCEHHALPFYGVAHVAYVAGPEIIGISKLTRLVRLYARRFTVQERLGEQIADTLVELVQPRGVAVHLEAAHLCTQMRGVAEEGSRTVTTFWRGLYDERRRAARRVPRRGSEPPLRPLELLFERRPACRDLDLPAELRALYGGGLGFDEPCVFANFVETIDGVVAIPDLPRSNALIAAESEADRFVMGLLRASADAVLVGSGTMLASPTGTWQPERVYPRGGRGVRRATAPPRTTRVADRRVRHRGRFVRSNPSGARARRDRPDDRAAPPPTCGQACPRRARSSP